LFQIISFVSNSFLPFYNFILSLILIISSCIFSIFLSCVLSLSLYLYYLLSYYSPFLPLIILCSLASSSVYFILSPFIHIICLNILLFPLITPSLYSPFLISSYRAPSLSLFFIHIPPFIPHLLLSLLLLYAPSSCHYNISSASFEVFVSLSLSHLYISLLFKILFHFFSTSYRSYFL